MMIINNGKNNRRNNLKNNRMMRKRYLKKSIHSQKKVSKEIQFVWLFQQILFFLTLKIGKYFYYNNFILFSSEI